MSDEGLAVIVKSVALNTAVCTVSGTIVPAFAIVTHVVVPETLLELHPVWYPMGVLVVDATTLYMAVKSNPVVGLGGGQTPACAKQAAAKCIVSGVSVDWQLDPEPPMQSDTMRKLVVEKIEPVRSTPEG